MTSPTVVAASSALQPLTDPITLAVPAGAAVGDLLVVMLGAQSSTAAADPTVNAGTWATRAQTSGAATRYAWIGSKVYTAGDPTSFAFTYPAGIGSSRRVGQMVAVRGSAGVGVATAFETFTGNTADNVRQVGHTTVSGLTNTSLLLNFAHWTTAAPNTATPPAVGSGWGLVNAAAHDATGASSSQWQQVYSKTNTATTMAGPAELVPGPSLASNVKQLLEILPIVAQAPTAAFTATATGLSVAFDASTSTDPDGTITGYAWDFGDGATGTGKTVTHKYALSGSYNVKLTVTDNTSLTNSLTKAVPVGLTTVTLASDSYSRTATNGWGTADMGGAWTATGGLTAAFSVAGGKGAITLQPGDTRQIMLDTTSSTTAVAQVSAAADKAYAGGAGGFNIVGRQVGSSNYAARVRVESGNVIRLYILLDETALGGGASYVLPSTYVAGQVLNIKLSVTGTSPTTVAAKVWAAGDTEPPAWNLTATDSTAGMQTAGTVGLRGQLSSASTNSPMVMTFDDYTVLSEGYSANPWAHLTVWDGTTEKTVVDASLWDGTTEQTVVSATAYVQPSATATAGALPIGQAAYPIPEGAVYVTAGSSVQAALDAVPYGGTVVLRAGTHRVATMLQTKRPCIIQNAPGEAAWLDGSKVIPTANWAPNGNGTWSAAYTCKPRITQTGWPSADNPDGVKIPDQCWINGARQWTVKDGQTPAAGQVSFNPATSRITIYGDPAGKTVEASAATAMLFHQYPATIRGFGVRRSSPTAYEWDGAGIYTGSENQIAGSVYENLHIVDHGNIGLYCFGAKDVTIAACTITDCGMSGVEIGSNTAVPAAAKTGTVERSVFTRINFKKFDAEPTTACIKSSRANQLTIRNNHMTDFYFCSAVWTDISCIRTQVVGNYINGTASTLGKAGRAGVEVELSDGGGSGGSQERSLIAGNTIIGCQSSLWILCTAHHDVVNNTYDGGTGSGGGAYVTQDSRMGNGTDPANRPNDATWQTSHNRFINNRIGPGRRQWFITGSYALHGFNGMDYFETGTSIAGNWAEPAGSGNDFCSIQRRDDQYSAPLTWPAWKGMTTIGDTSKIGGNGQGAWADADALTYAVPLEAAWATALGKPVGWKGVGNPLPPPTPQ